MSETNKIIIKVSSKEDQSVSRDPEFTRKGRQSLCLPL